MILVIVYNCYISLCSVLPTEYDAPLLIDSNTPVARQIAFELFKAIAGWNL